MQNFSDPTDFCRRCGGRGGHRERTERGTYITEPCDLCHGSGNKTVRVTAPQLGIEARDQ